MPEMPRTKFNSPWTVANIETELNGVKAARGNGTMSEALEAKQNLLVIGTNLDAVPTAESANPVTSGGVFAMETPATIPGAVSIHDLSPGWWSRTTNLSQVTDTPSDYSGGFICHVINTGIGNPKRKMIFFYPISAGNTGKYYRQTQTGNGWENWFLYAGTEIAPVSAQLSIGNNGESEVR